MAPLQPIARWRALLHYDFCPQWNVYVYWLKKPIGWLFLALIASILLGIVVAPKAFFASAIIVGIALVGCVWPWISTRGLQATLHWKEPRCEAGDEITVSIRFRNSLPFPVWGMVIHSDDELCVDTQRDQPIAFGRIPAFANSQFQWKTSPQRRGVFPRTKVRIGTSFPFGLWSVWKEVEVSKTILVWPRTVELNGFPEDVAGPNAARGNLRQRAGNEGDWTGVRPYREGDPLRSIHWSQSARRNALVVCERQDRGVSCATLWIDPKACTSSDELAGESLLSFVASAAKHLIEQGWHVRVMVGDRPLVTSLTPSRIPKLFDELALFRWNVSADYGYSRCHRHPDDWCWVVTMRHRMEELRSLFPNSNNRIAWFLADRMDAVNASLSNPISTSKQDASMASLEQTDPQSILRVWQEQIGTGGCVTWN